MKAFQRCSLFALAGVCLLMASCVDSKEPISDPLKAKTDPALLGVWRGTNENGGVKYYHIGRAGNLLPEGILRAVGVGHSKNGELSEPLELLMFSSKVGESRFLNVVAFEKKENLAQLTKSGWNSKLVKNYWIFKYELQGNESGVRGNALDIWACNDKHKLEAIRAGKIKGKINRSDRGHEEACITDTSENLAKFLASPDGAKLFDKEPTRCQRVK